MPHSIRKILKYSCCFDSGSWLQLSARFIEISPALTASSIGGCAGNFEWKGIGTARLCNNRVIPIPGNSAIRVVVITRVRAGVAAVDS